MGKVKSKRSLASRKKAKDVSMAILDNAFSKADRYLADAPKQDCETGLTRGAKEMQRTIQRMRDREAGIAKPQPVHREDLPKPPRKQDADQRGSKKGARPGKPAAVDASESNGGSMQTGGGARTMNDGAAMDSSARARAPTVGPAGAAGGSSGAGSGGLGVVSGSKKRPRDHPEEPPRAKFGDTNTAPPTLLIGGNLSKQVAAARVAALKVDAIERQRETVLANYAKVKAARRDAQRGQS